MAQFPICVVKSTSVNRAKASLASITITSSSTAMFDQLKHAIARPMTGKSPAEKHFSGVSAQSKLEKTDPSTAFECSGWVYI
ncbi:hypothetical protein PF005_g22434 [Phytophthora fragariae]|uniref:Uncharacterized protein n=1 Tax=Phytophthora fragariae TaxID=53985 RepID=A0A6A4CG82_9STRA|nr:hypothetical protein PF003_g19026 [Phytophthora fragariae]KAE8897037.1 hypothetical protein PF003_g19028 [Phytophthora fragariae]KAE8926630.1 hypothetical protein PF009_g23185 [Phytophthora fragariae]KAE8983784.1 hypothetical protein PF011_g21040 [Phytophthora fragariae]KAE9082479.1 hypothetical protein PF010_g21572 [Phytophthora fragariae]